MQAVFVGVRKLTPTYALQGLPLFRRLSEQVYLAFDLGGEARLCGIRYPQAQFLHAHGLAPRPETLESVRMAMGGHGVSLFVARDAYREIGG